MAAQKNLLSFALSSSLLFLAIPKAKAASLAVDISFVGSLGKSSLAGEAASPSMGVYTVAATGGLLLLDIFEVGARSGYQAIVQLSDPNPGTYGNRRGSRLALIAPSAGVRVGKIIVRGDYQFLGDYVLTNRDSDGNTVTYKKPSGFGAEALYSLSSSVAMGARFEKISFSQVKVGAGITDLADKLSLTSYGVLFHVGL